MKKLITLALAGVMAMALLGVGYALWSETLTINGTVNTGSIEAVWSVVGGEDSETGSKESASSVTCALGELAAGAIDYKVAIVTLNNAYPSIDYWCDFDVHSTGNVPIHFGNASLLADPALLAATDGVNPDGSSSPSTLEIVPPPAGTYCLATSPVTQLHLNDTCYIRILVHLDNDAVQSSTMTFTGSVEYHQWNEP